MSIKRLAVAAAFAAALFSSRLVQSAAVLTEPAAHSRIDNRLDFPVVGSIDGYERDRAENLHYWVSIATVRRDGTPELHWPKFYVKRAQFAGRVSDGGQNPFPDPQKMLLLVLKVDDATSQQFSRWLSTGAALGYPGLQPNVRDIVAQIPITFP